MFPIFAGNSASTGYNLTRSLRFRASATAYLNRTNTSSVTNNKIFTYSLWVKRGALTSTMALLSGDNSLAQHYFGFGNSTAAADNLEFYDAQTAAWKISTNNLFRDPSACYHIILSVDTTQATAANRVRIYVNGVEASYATATYPAQNTVPNINVASMPLFISKRSNAAQWYFDGYLAEVNFIDGQALTPSSFGSTNALTGVWQPARYTGTYGTNGFYLPFTDNSALTTSSNVGLGKDFSGNANYWVTNNISITAGVTYDSMTDVPTLTSATAANFCVMNPLRKGADNTLSDANLKSTFTSFSFDELTTATIGVTSGKWYFEGVVDIGSSRGSNIGILATSVIVDTSATAYQSALLYAYIVNSGNKFNNNTSTAYGAACATGDIVGVAFDLDNGKIWFSKNGTWQASGDPAAGTNPAFSGLTATTYTASFYTWGNQTWIANFGQRPFTYTPPTGFVALNTYNLPTSTIVKGNTVMDATLYTGTLLSNAITNAASFKPDLVWVKSRSAATDHKLTDSVRGVTKGLISNTAGAETTDTQGLTAFGSAGFTVGTDTNYNNLAATYVAWQWQAGQGSSSSNTNGTITSTVSVNASAGFSVVTYTGTGVAATVGHGLGVAPTFIIVKNRTNAFSWSVYLASLGNTQYLFLNSSNATASDVGQWNNTTPTSSVFSIGTSNNTGASATNYVAYCWTPIAGFSAFGSYTGNGSADGPFVYTGFRPKFVLIKGSSFASNWFIEDSARNGYNVNDGVALRPNLSGAEDGTTTYNIDILSNGFKLRSAAGDSNTSGATFIYAAFAENPTKNALAR